MQRNDPSQKNAADYIQEIIKIKKATTPQEEINNFNRAIEAIVFLKTTINDKQIFFSKEEVEKAISNLATRDLIILMLKINNIYLTQLEDIRSRKRTDDQNKYQFILNDLKEKLFSRNDFIINEVNIDIIFFEKIYKFLLNGEKRGISPDQIIKDIVDLFSKSDFKTLFTYYKTNIVRKSVYEKLFFNELHSRLKKMTEEEIEALNKEDQKFYISAREVFFDKKDHDAFHQMMFNLDQTELYIRPKKVSLEDITENKGRLLSETQKNTAIKELDASENAHIQKKISGLGYALAKFEHPHIEGRYEYFAIYKGEKQDKALGSGGSGKVKLMQNIETGAWYAIKIPHKPEKNNDLNREQAIIESKNEIQFMNKLKSMGAQHASRTIGSLNRTKEYISESTASIENQKQDLVGMDLINGDDLRTWIHAKAKMPPLRWIELLQETTKPIEEAHRFNIIHRDIKPENLIRDPVTGKIKLIDWAFSMDEQLSQYDKQDNIPGTAGYMAPELNFFFKKNFSKSSDIYALGITMAELLDLTKDIKRKRQFGNGYEIDSYEPKIISPKQSKSFRRRIPNKDAQTMIHTLILQMTQNTPSKRPTIKEVQESLSQIQTLLLNNDLQARANYRKIGILNLDDYYAASPSLKADMIDVLKAQHADEVRLISADAKWTTGERDTWEDMQQIEALTDAGLMINPKILHGIPNDTRSVIDLLNRVPKKIQAEYPDKVPQYVYVESPKSNSEEKPQLTDDIHYFTGPLPRQAAIASLQEDIKRMTAKMHTNPQVYKRKIEVIQKFIEDLDEHPKEDLGAALKKLEVAIKTGKGFIQKNKFAGKIIGFFPTTSTSQRHIRRISKEIKAAKEKPPELKH